VGRLITSNPRDNGNILETLRSATDQPGHRRRARDALGETNKPHILRALPDLTNWIPLIANTPMHSFFEFLDTNAPALDRRFYRGVKP
jgi:hypothetical protein